MFRRLLSVAGILGLLGVALPSTPVSADPDASASAVVTGTIELTDTDCTVVNGKPGSEKPGNGEPGKIIEFDGLVLNGVFSDGNGANVYAGQIALTPGPPIEACSHSLVPGTEPFPPSVGDIRDPDRTPDFEGISADGQKCIAGELGDLTSPSGPPLYGPDHQVGDFVTPATVASVKFDISWETGNVPVLPCTPNKATVNEVDCIGTLKATPPVPPNPGAVAGDITCDNDLPSNFGAKQG